MMSKALIVFVKAPVAGEVKTRLGKTIGYKKAAQIYEELLKYTAKVCGELEDVTVFIFHASEVLPANYFSHFENRIQVAGDLGVKMNDATKQVFSKGYSSVICIGSDCVSITKETINKAFEVLQKKEYVIGPAEDGGYYLIGMKKISYQLFKDISWSTPSVLKQTLAKIPRENYDLLEILSDIDDELDLLRNKNALKEFNPDFFSFL